MQIPDPFYSEKKCPACGKISQGDFCMHCGEKLQHDRISFKHFIRDIPFVFFNFGPKFFRTVFALAKSPGNMVKKYFSGDRVRYFKPINYFMFIGGFVVLLHLTFHIGGTNDKFYEDLLDNKDLGKKLDQFDEQFLAGLLFIQFPIIAVFTWLFFRKRKHLFGEHLVANAFFIGEVSLYWIILFPAFLIFNHTKTADTLFTVYSLFVVAYYVYAFYDWLYNKKTWKGFFLIFIFVVVLYLLITVLTIFLLPVLYVIKEGLSNLF